MKPPHFFHLIFFFLLAGLVHAEDAAMQGIHIVPAPAMVKSLQGTFTLNERTRLLVEDPESRRIAAIFNDFLLANHGIRLKIDTSPLRGRAYIVLTETSQQALPIEGYRLLIQPGKIIVMGAPAGLFYGMQTLLQMLPMEMRSSFALPAVDITDYPRFHYRGVLLDVARHFFPVPSIKKLLDLLAQYKINRFQWHLTDDEAWRIEIKRYPELTRSFPGQQNLDPYGRGYYTQEQVKDLVEYARARFITIVPEIEMPGHSQAALAAYPTLGCTAPSASISATFRNDVFCPKEKTFQFLQNVLDEVIALFPGPYVHIGGDEVVKDSWKQSPEAQAIKQRHGLKDENELETYFVQHMEQFLRSRGKRTIGWDEILEGGLAPNAIVMSWRGESGGVAAAKQKHQVIMSPTDYCYFDYYQGDARREPPAIGGFLPLAKVYAYDPVPAELAPDEQKYILGAQANVWGEYIRTPEHLEYMVFPRLFAFSEVAWSQLAIKNYHDFLERLPYQLARLEQQDVNYRVPEPDGLKDLYTATDDHANIQLTSFLPGSQMYYTLDGSTPTEQSTLYKSPFQVPLEPDHKTLLNVIVVNPRGRHSEIYGATLLRRPYVDAVAYNGNQPGLAFTLYEGKFTSTRDLDSGTQSTAGNTDSLDLAQFRRQLNYGVNFDGYIKTPDDGFYEFGVESDDGGTLKIDGEEVVDNDGNHGNHLAQGYIPLRKGFHRFQLRYFQGEGDSSLRVSWALAGQQLKPVDGSVLYH